MIAINLLRKMRMARSITTSEIVRANPFTVQAAKTFDLTRIR